MFTHLHTHTEYSLLDGMSRIGPLLDRVKELGMESVAMTDHGALYGAIDFYQGARARGLKPIIGVEAYVAPGSRKSRERGDNQPYHLVLLARNNTGYRNLLALVTKANLEGYYYKPRMDRELLEQHSEGLTALSGCPSSEFFQRLEQGDREGAIDVARWYREVFDGHYYLEVQEHGIERFSRINPRIADVGRELQIPVVVTNDSHFTVPEEHDAHDTLLCIGTNATIDQENRFKIEGEGYYVRSEAEMRALFPGNPDFIDNTRLVADECDLDLEFGRQQLPAPVVPAGRESGEYLAELCRKGLEQRVGSVTPALQERLDYELDVLRNTGFTDYIYIVKDISDFARQREIRMGVRGSAAASLVLYSLGVTDIDPVANNLVFERFLNLERREMPDVDFDFADDRRDEMFRFAYERYGEDRVAQIITFGTLGAKAAVRDVGRAHGLSYGDTDRVARLIPNALHVTLEEAIEQVGELREYIETDPRIKRLIDTARQLEGVARHASTHAAAVVIAREPLIEQVPLQRPSRGDETSIPTTQYAMDQVAAIGLLKMDFLGLSNLTILGRAVDLIAETTGERLDLLNLPDGDEATMEMLGRGETFGVFQLESAGMRRYVQDLKPTSIADLCAMVALYRPGPMQHIPRYIDGKHGKITVTYPHADLAEILDETYGVIVYQDQVLHIARKFAGYSLGQADVMRKAMGKKKAEIMQAERSRFVEGAIANGYREDEATAVFDLIEPFAGYAFNKAHSWCYGNIAYQTAYLKALYPVQYMTAVLQLTRSSPDPHARIAAAVAECSKLGIEVLPPNIDRSDENFSVERLPDGPLAIRFGLGVVKNVGSAAVEGIIAERVAGGPYRDVEDFCKRADLSGANSRAIEHLAMAGAMDMLGHERGTLVMNAERLMSLARRERELRESGQSTMFDLFGSEVDAPLPALELEPHHVEPETMLGWEKELLGVYVSEHPFRNAAAEIAKYTTHSISDLSMELAGQTLTLGGMVNGVQARTTRDGRKFYVVSFEDLSGTAELTVWNDVIESQGEELWSEGQVLVVSVEARERAERLNLSVRKAARFDRAEGAIVGFAPEQWQVEAAKDRPRRRPPAGNGGQFANQHGHTNGNGTGSGRAHGGSTAEAASARVAPPVDGDAVRLSITIYETENEVHDEALLKSVVGLLNGAPGQHAVRLVIHDAEGQEMEFDLPTAEVTERLAESIRGVLRQNGTVTLSAARSTAA